MFNIKLIKKKLTLIYFFFLFLSFISCNQKESNHNNLLKTKKEEGKLSKFKTYDKSSLEDIIIEMYGYYFKNKNPLSSQLNNSNDLKSIQFLEKIFFINIDKFVKAVENSFIEALKKESFNEKFKDLEKTGIDHTISANRYKEITSEYSFMGYINYISYLETQPTKTSELEDAKEKFLRFMELFYLKYRIIKTKYQRNN